MTPRTEYDAAWKATLEAFLQPCLAMTFPGLAEFIDWSVTPKFLDTELQEIVRDSESGPMRVDKLIEVRRWDGGNELLLLHVEVQAQRDDDLARRMFRYFARILERFGREPVSLAILADPVKGWRPTHYEQSKLGCSVRFGFLTCKLIELEIGPWLAAGNPVAQVIEAHCLALGTGKDMRARRGGKLAMVRRLRESGMGELEAREVMRLVHWLLALPREEELAFRQDVKEMEASMHMPRRSTYEQIVWEEGLEQGLEKGRDEGRVEGRVEGRIAGAQEVLVDLVAERFGGVGPGLRGRIESIVDGVRLRQLARAAVTVSSLSEFEQRVGQ